MLFKRNTLPLLGSALLAIIFGITSAQSLSAGDGPKASERKAMGWNIDLSKFKRNPSIDPGIDPSKFPSAVCSQITKLDSHANVHLDHYDYTWKWTNKMDPTDDPYIRTDIDFPTSISNVGDMTGWVSFQAVGIDSLYCKAMKPKFSVKATVPGSGVYANLPWTELPVTLTSDDYAPACNFTYSVPADLMKSLFAEAEKLDPTPDAVADHYLAMVFSATYSNCDPWDNRHYITITENDQQPQFTLFSTHWNSDFGVP